MTVEWTPQNDRQHPPFEPGNTLALRHGFWSKRRVDPIAAELIDQVLADPATAYLQAARWLASLWAWARAEAQVQLLTEYLAKRGEESGDGVGDLDSERVRSAYTYLHRAETRAMSLRTRLGLDPLSAARLGRDKTATALDAAQLMAQLEKSERDRLTQDDKEKADDGGE